MKPGSLVVCVDASGISFPWMPLVQDNIYTVRQLVNTNKGLGLYLEEVLNEKNKGNEIGYIANRFRELDTPTEIKLENILENELV